MTDIRSLPIELLEIIFQHVAAPAFRQETRWDAELPTIPSRALFPFNVASVCTLWLDILKSHPPYWQRVVIDIADDPAPFLDTFSLYTDETNTRLDLIVFSSTPNIDKRLEKLRARTIFEHLELSITRYGTITFHLVYQSSLPTSADVLSGEAGLDLTELHLTCTTHDLHDDKTTDVGFDDLSYLPGPVIHTQLAKLSITGFAFMELCRAGQLATYQPRLQLSINHFGFRKKRRSEGSIQSTFPVFLTAFETLSKRTVLDVMFSDLSSEYRTSTKLTSRYNLQIENLSFDNVSSDFILAFFSCVTFSDDILDFVSFRKCSIPFLGYTGLPQSENIHLELVELPSQTPRAPPSTVQHSRDNSICNAIKSFPPNELRILRCDGLTDDLFEWLNGDNNSKAKAPLLESIVLRDCTQFTPSSLISLLVHRYTQSEKGYVSAITEVTVHGKGPALSQDDVSRIVHDANLRTMYINWSVERDDNVGEDLVTELHCPIVSDTFLQDSENLVSLFHLV